MLASRHHSSRIKACQLSRAISTLKHSSNQKGFRARNKKRKALAAAVSNARMSTEPHVHGSCAEEVSGEPIASLLTAVLEGSILAWIPATPALFSASSRAQPFFRRSEGSRAHRLARWDRTAQIPNNNMLRTACTLPTFGAGEIRIRACLQACRNGGVVSAPLGAGLLDGSLRCAGN